MQFSYPIPYTLQKPKRIFLLICSSVILTFFSDNIYLQSKQIVYYHIGYCLRSHQVFCSWPLFLADIGWWTNFHQLMVLHPPSSLKKVLPKSSWGQVANICFHIYSQYNSFMHHWMSRQKTSQCLSHMGAQLHLVTSRAPKCFIFYIANTNKVISTYRSKIWYQLTRS